MPALAALCAPLAELAVGYPDIAASLAAIADAL
jgi:hypothetical protein